MNWYCLYWILCFTISVVSFIHTHICNPQNVCDKRKKQRWPIEPSRHEGGWTRGLSRWYTKLFILNVSISSAKWSLTTLKLRFGWCDYRKQLPKCKPGSDGLERSPVCGGKGQLTAKQGAGPPQAWSHWTPYTHHGTSRTILIFPSSHLPSADAIPCTHGASSSPAAPYCGSANAGTGNPASTARTCSCASR